MKPMGNTMAMVKGSPSSQTHQLLRNPSGGVRVYSRPV